jgi:hypothetical protein
VTAGFFSFDATLHCDAVPRIWHVAIKFARMQPVNHPPCTSAECYGFFSLAWSRTIRAGENYLVNLVRADWCYGFDLASADPVTFLAVTSSTRSIVRS